ncbi:N-acetylornithine aminotransferase [Candidatus Syntrophocurvum alkaliphilum]|uniref:Acetylornithine aminotransferase n=1 Tax=Candidatus Syntrophocurvum alkaliphilum TaxID=2293317 RepID=A0A6I6DPB0_9FIRM|nr:aspartate aminotransferase family protein [Candidatus Syntrophocurvum alkaliphilum]QGU00821.1 N-acetylornithine aminotransferase [Candidatus Syntrophocurvum alkaliphilum]
MTNKDIMDKGQQYVMNTYGRFPITMVKGEGAYLWDVDGKQYLDFVGGIAVCSLGHCNNDLQKVLKEQATKLWHTSNLYWIKPQVELAEKLVNLSGMGKAFFCNSGAEANEAAIKLARKYFYRKKEGNKNEIVVFNNSFHGRTLATVTATGQPKYQEGFAPLPTGFAYAEFNNIDSVKNVVNENTCAIMVEAIQGEGGITPADLNFLQEIRKICDQQNLLLIFDEVQTGIGRTGEFFSYQTYGVTPDIITLAKGLGGGFPIGAMLATDDAANGFAPGDHASTFGGNYLATVVANEVVDTISEQQFLDNVDKAAEQLFKGINELNDSRIKNIRGKGLMLGIEFDTEVKDLISICMNKGLLLIGAGTHVLRFVPPLNIKSLEITQAVSILKEALKEWN